MSEIDPAIMDLIQRTVDLAVSRAVQSVIDNPPIPKAYYNDSAAIAYLGLRSPRSLEVMRREGKGPRFRRVNGRWPIYTRQQLDDWLLEFPEITPAEAKS